MLSEQSYKLLDEIRSVLSYEHDEKKRTLLNKCLSHIRYLEEKVETFREECYYISSIGNSHDNAHRITSSIHDKNIKTPAKEMEKQRS